MSDPVNHPRHYTQHPSGVECIEIVEHMNFNRGNAVKYIWRAGDKEREIEDLKKARWYVDREIARLERAFLSQQNRGGKESGQSVVVPTQFDKHFLDGGPSSPSSRVAQKQSSRDQ